jgi:hypothetical protein
MFEAVAYVKAAVVQRLVVRPHVDADPVVALPPAFADAQLRIWVPSQAAAGARRSAPSYPSTPCFPYLRCWPTSAFDTERVRVQCGSIARREGPGA